MAGKPIELRFITRRVEKGVEWSGREGAPPLVGLSGDDPASWAPLGEKLSSEFRVVAVNLKSPYDLLNAIWATGEPAIVVAQGAAACGIAARAAIQGVGAVRALVLVEFGKASDEKWLKDIAVPTLVFRGRQSEVQSHEDAVTAHELIKNSHLIEPEDCGEKPAQEYAGTLAASIEWYLDSLGSSHMDYPVNGEPIDPKTP